MIDPPRFEQTSHGLGKIVWAVIAFFMLFGLVPSLLPEGEPIAEFFGAAVARLAVGVLLLGYIARTWPKKEDLSKRVSSHGTLIPPAVPTSPPPAAPRGRTPACEAIRQTMRLSVMYDEEIIDRLVAMERERLPRATDEELHLAARERLLRDNR